MNEETLGNEWDLFEVIAERAQPTDKVSVYLNEVASFAKSSLIKQKENTPQKDVATIEELDSQIVEAEELLEKSKYTFYITAIPSRMREDLASKAMHHFPMKLNVLGQDDAANAIARNKYNNDLLWHSQITRIDNPAGQKNTDFTFEQIVQVAEGLPTAAQQAIDNAIAELTKSSERFTANSQSIDF